MAIYKCKDCPFFEKKGGGGLLSAATYYCNKFKTKVNYDKSACAEMKGK
ncbi:MAG: hypothetical protein WA124_13400 [Smithella sp.]